MEAESLSFDLSWTESRGVRRRSCEWLVTEAGCGDIGTQPAWAGLRAGTLGDSPGNNAELRHLE